jgi:hypothetical protein
MSSLIDIEVPPNKRHPIWLYYIERTNIVNVFRSMFRTFLITDKDMSLTAVEDKRLADKLLETMNYVSPVENSTVTRQLAFLRC